MSIEEDHRASIKTAEKSSMTIPHTHLMLHHGVLDAHTAKYKFPGSGTQEDPYIVGWVENDPRNPLHFNDSRKWLWSLLMALATMAVALTTSAYTAPAKELKADFGISQEVFELGLSLFVLGFAVGPIFWAPLSEIAILSGTMCILVAIIVPETYGPFLLKRRAQALSKLTGDVHVSKLNKNELEPTLRAKLKIALSRPWLMLFHEPIVLILTVYLALLYGTVIAPIPAIDDSVADGNQLYMFFGAFPIVYQTHRGWSEGISGLSFCGIALGILLGILYMFPENTRYQKIVDRNEETPETRLPPSIVGSIAIPISIFWFAWSNSPTVHWIVSIAAQVPFGFGFVLVYISVQEYLVDAYTVYAASVLAANTIFRSAFGAVFPLFTNVGSLLSTFIDSVTDGRNV
ncbi:MAG: hypothetical protein Q9201_005230 [Fulgogasparrea decipioides]